MDWPEGTHVRRHGSQAFYTVIAADGCKLGAVVPDGSELAKVQFVIASIRKSLIKHGGK